MFLPPRSKVLPDSLRDGYRNSQMLKYGFLKVGKETTVIAGAAGEPAGVAGGQGGGDGGGGGGGERGDGQGGWSVDGVLAANVSNCMLLG